MYSNIKLLSITNTFPHVLMFRWTAQDSPNNNPNATATESGFLGLPYLPFFSNCKGSDSYISLSKLLETGKANYFIDSKIKCFINMNLIILHINSWRCLWCAYIDPFCTLVPVGQTVAVSQYPWSGSLNPNSDYCNTSTPAGPLNSQVGPYNGAIYECSFEENTAVLLAGVIRWYRISRIKCHNCIICSCFI